MMKFVRELLAAKGNAVWSVAPEDTVYSAIERMADRGVGLLVVLDRGQIAGVISERDYARKVILKGRASKDISVRSIMTSWVVYAQPEQSIDECLALMTDKRIRHLPIMEDDELVGIVSIGDLVKAVIAEQQFVINQLERYING